MRETLAPQVFDSLRDIVDAHLIEAEIAAREIKRRTIAVHAVSLRPEQRQKAAEIRDMLAIIVGNLTKKIGEPTA